MSISEIDVQISYTRVKKQELYISSLKIHHSKLLEELKKEKLNLIKLNKKSSEETTKKSFEEITQNEDDVAINCRWDKKCTNSKCKYTHPNGRTFVPKTLCWNGSNCTRKNCSFKH